MVRFVLCILGFLSVVVVVVAVVAVGVAVAVAVVVVVVVAVAVAVAVVVVVAGGGGDGGGGGGAGGAGGAGGCGGGGGAGGGADASTSATFQGRPEDSSYDRHYTRWAKVWMMVAGGVNLELTPHHQANARFLSEDGLGLWPWSYRRID